MSDNEDWIVAKTMTVDQLIARLVEIREKHGNLPVLIMDADTGWELAITQFEVGDDYERGQDRLYLGGAYEFP